jgi:hypothetical protein
MKLQVIKTDKGYVAVSDEPKKQGHHFACTNQLKNGYVPIHNDFGMADDCCKPIVATDTTFKLEGIPQFKLEKKRNILFEATDRAYKYLYALGYFTTPTHEGKIVENLLIEARAEADEEKGCYTEEDIIKGIKLFNRAHKEADIKPKKGQDFIDAMYEYVISSLKQPKQLVAIEVETIQASQWVANEKGHGRQNIEIPKANDYGLLTIKQYFYE